MKYIKIILLSLFFLGGISFLYSNFLANKINKDITTEEDKPLVSVILPTYNREKFLKRSIESILNQTYTQFELIIIDDGSNDNSLQLIHQYAQKDNRIIVLANKKNKGISISRNRAYKYAKGRYIMPMDSDDRALPEKLEKQVAYMEKFPDIDLLGSYSRNIDNPSIIFQTSPMNPHLETLFGNPFGHVETLIRKTFLDQHHIHYDETYQAAVDYDLFAQMMMAGAHFKKLPVVLSEVRRHHSNPEAYYIAQRNNHRKIQKKLFDFYNIPYPVTSSQCLILSHLTNYPPPPAKSGISASMA